MLSTLGGVEAPRPATVWRPALRERIDERRDALERLLARDARRLHAPHLCLRVRDPWRIVVSRSGQFVAFAIMT
jgi:hypothetical protein